MVPTLHLFDFPKKKKARIKGLIWKLQHVLIRVDHPFLRELANLNHIVLSLLHASLQHTLPSGGENIFSCIEFKLVLLI